MKIAHLKTGGQDDERVPHAEPSSQPQEEYPYGTRVSLDHDTLQKLGMFEPPQVGTTLPMGGKGVVTAVRKEGDKHHVEMQITHLGFDHGEAKSAAAKVYDKGPGDGTD